MIREFSQQWDKDYVRKMAETLQAQDDRRKSVVEKNDQRTDIDETMGEGGGDEEEDGESEDDNEDGHGSGGAVKRSGTHPRKLCSFYFRTGVVVRTTTDNGRDVTDPLMWWKQHQQEFPDLARMARQYLEVPATSASPERFFSRVGLVQTDLSGRLLDTTMIDLMWPKQAP